MEKMDDKSKIYQELVKIIYDKDIQISSIQHNPKHKELIEAFNNGTT